MGRVLELIEPWFGEWGYAIVFAATFLENATFVGTVVPGDVVLLLAGVFALRGALDLGGVVAVAFAGAVLGDVVGYAVGRFGGRWVAERFGKRLFLPPQRLARVERYFQRNGAWAVFLGRFAPLVRTVRTFVAGITRMSFWRFVAADAAGAALWSALVPLLGYLFAESLRAVQRGLGAGGVVLLVVLAGLFVVTYRAMVRRLEREEGDR